LRREGEDEADGFGFAAVEFGDVGGFEEIEAGLADFRSELLANFGIAEAGLREDDDAVEHVGKLMRGGFGGGFAFGDEAKLVRVGLGGDGDPLQLREQQVKLWRTIASRDAQEARQTIASDHGEHRRAGETVKPLFPVFVRVEVFFGAQEFVETGCGGKKHNAIRQKCEFAPK